jgi:hypothetical protein
MPRAPTKCAVCPADATYRNRCQAHQVGPWKRRSPSSRALAGNSAHRKARAAAIRRTKGCCEDCGEKHPELDLHHPTPISQGGAIVQPDALLLCPSCHRAADRAAGARN